MRDEKLALFLMLGQTAEKNLSDIPDVVPATSMTISENFDLALVLPDEVRKAERAAAVFKLFFVFETFLRDFVLEVLSQDDKVNWWTKVPKDVQNDVEELEKAEEVKAWMALGRRERISLTTYNQLLKIIEDRWKDGFEPLVRDKFLIQEARHIAHLRNATCHMTDLPDEELLRTKQVLRDWFRIVSP